MTSNGTIYDMRDKVALVTGASSGIGRATALAFAKAGARVMLADVQDEAGDAAAREIAACARLRGGDARFVHADVSSAADVRAMVAHTVETFGGLDYAFNNAGIEGALAPTADYPDETWQRVLAINLTGVFLCMKHEIPALRARGGGAIVNNASILGLVGFASAPAYTAAKHGVLGLTKVTAQELATEGIRVNAVCPGFIETPMVMERGVALAHDDAARREVAGLHPMNRLGTSEEIAAAVLWLCSGAASFVTGEPLVVDGGYVTR
ncbi:short-chain dehydrogenase/reductase SDR (plasmid) [Gemmatirosa kalamazoonensis]|uniref:Short-chain dehydrogenase/reductase SDR n=1 Tax=Gemmatirosa kalamazoonensis TaxID=861299 RepID=W0RNK5_9BACT|nr:glucose 1-dehydrogenase [Gemmatirosa kalamazoonensis]AHG92594.1 short-chain dehydrogenase/reductase SDR [Gemmatirosa kalamazoonensis]